MHAPLKIFAMGTALLMVAAACQPAAPGPAAATAAPPSAAAAAATAAPTPDPRVGGTFFLAKQSVAGKLDPIKAARTTTEEQVMSQVYGTLVYYKPGTWEVAPDLAASWQVSQDGREYVFRLRGGQKFHDGSEITADDVVFSLERGRAATSLNRDRFTGVDKIEAVDGSSVRVRLKERDPFFLDRMASVYGSPIVPKAAVQRFGDDFGNKLATLVGSGPFKLVEWTESRLVYERFDGYWDRALVDKVVQTVVPDQQTTVLQFEAGKIDWLPIIFNPRDAPRLKAKFRVTSGTIPSVFFIQIRNDKPPYDDVRVRRAIAQLIDKKQILNATLQGDPTDSLIIPTFAGYDPSVSSLYPRDAARAQQLLREAGVDLGQSLTLRVYNSPHHITHGEIIQQQVGSAGMKLRIDPIDFATMTTNISQGKYDFFFNFANARVPDAASLLFEFWHSRGPSNKYYKNAEVDSILDRATAEQDKAARAKLAAQAERLILQDAVVIPLFNRVNNMALQPWLKGLDDVNLNVGFSPDGGVRWNRFWIDGSLREKSPSR